MTRYQDQVPKTGTGRPTHGAGKVPDVRDLPCPSRTDLADRVHVLVTNTEKGEAVTRCAWCRVKWENLDATVRPPREAS